MKLDLKDRLILVNQCRILEALYPEDANHYEKHRAALEGGYELHYSWMVEWFSKEGLTKDQCREVLDILEMYREITFAKQRLDSEELNANGNLVFEGFDGNNEGELRAYVEYFVVDLGRYDELKGGREKPSFNSHTEMLPFYRKQLEIWRGFDRSHGWGHELTEEQLKLLAEPYGN